MLRYKEREYEEEKDKDAKPENVLVDDYKLLKLKPKTLCFTHANVPFLNAHAILKSDAWLWVNQMGSIVNTRISQEDIDRFMSYVSVDEQTGAWLWTGGIANVGYGGFWYKGRTIGAHVFAYWIKHGPIPPGMLVCHKFEDLGRHNVNPDHLFLGTHADNMRDAAQKKRTLAGSQNHASKLSDDNVRALAASDETYKVLSERYGVSQAMISQIKRGCRWTHITGIEPTKKKQLRNKSGYTGVRWRERGKKWNAAIGQKINGTYKSTHLGGYETAEDAARAYDAAAIKIHGPDARLNFPTE